MYKVLEQDFYNRPTLDVARDLLGKVFVFGSKKGIINEVESYIGQDDPACHAARGKTVRNEVMFGPPGRAYVYLIYGMYYCLNFVTEEQGFPAAVLIRGVIPIEGIDKPCDGPGKLCREFGISKLQNGFELNKTSGMWVEDRAINIDELKKTPRIGISKGKSYLWRYICKAVNSIDK